MINQVSERVPDGIIVRLLMLSGREHIFGVDGQTRFEMTEEWIHLIDAGVVLLQIKRKLVREFSAYAVDHELRHMLRSKWVVEDITGGG